MAAVAVAVRNKRRKQRGAASALSSNALPPIGLHTYNGRVGPNSNNTNPDSIEYAEDGGKQSSVSIAQAVEALQRRGGRRRGGGQVSQRSWHVYQEGMGMTRGHSSSKIEKQNLESSFFLLWGTTNFLFLSHVWPEYFPYHSTCFPAVPVRISVSAVHVLGQLMDRYLPMGLSPFFPFLFAGVLLVPSFPLLLGPLDFHSRGAAVRRPKLKKYFFSAQRGYVHLDPVSPIHGRKSNFRTERDCSSSQWKNLACMVA